MATQPGTAHFAGLEKACRARGLLLTRQRIIDLDERRLDRIAWPDVSRLGFRIADHQVHFRGLCATCLADGPAREQ